VVYQLTDAIVIAETSDAEVKVDATALIEGVPWRRWLCSVGHGRQNAGSLSRRPPGSS
jgi:hypothetical protein